MINLEFLFDQCRFFTARIQVQAVSRPTLATELALAST